MLNSDTMEIINTLLLGSFILMLIMLPVFCFKVNKHYPTEEEGIIYLERSFANKPNTQNLNQKKYL